MMRAMGRKESRVALSARSQDDEKQIKSMSNDESYLKLNGTPKP